MTRKKGKRNESKRLREVQILRARVPQENLFTDGEVQRGKEEIMKYIAVFEVPDGYVMGCAKGKICPKDEKARTDKDFENVYASIEPLSAQQEEAFDRYNAVERLIQDLGIHNAYSMPGFWTNNGSDYKVIETKYNKGYFRALVDIEREARKRFGFAERTDADRCHFECIEAMEKEEREEE